MALTGKTIGQLTVSSGITQDSLFIIEQSGDTYSIPYSSMTSNSQGLQLLAKQEVSFDTPIITTGLFNIQIAPIGVCSDIEVGETIINLTNPGSSATTVYFDGSENLVVSGLTGDFMNGDQIEGQINSCQFELINSPVAQEYSFQTIPLNNSNKCIVESVYITNRSQSLQLNTNCFLKSQNIFENENMFSFINVNNALNSSSNSFLSMSPQTNNVLVQNQVYFMLTQQDINPVTADLYIYGYIIN